MAFNTNASRLYVVEETTEGTLKAPSAGSEALALQPGFEMSPNTDSQVNEELRASIGPSKPILGLERPTASFNHYLRGSGTEGNTPDFHLLMKSLFGSTSTNGTERTTDAGSTTTVVNVTAGGTDFSLGKALLVKAATYEIRPVHSVATNAITLGFALENAPGAGLGVGKCINYTPADSGHPTLSLWLYRANEANIEAMAGGRVVALDIDVDVGNLINMSFQVGGTKFFFNPFIITSSNNKIPITTDNVTDQEAVVATGEYQTPQALATAIVSALSAADPAETFTCTFSRTTGKFTIATTTSTVFSILWKTGASGADNDDDHIGTILGFSDAADDTGATTYTADNEISYADGQTPALDDSDPLVAKDMEVLIGDQSDYIRPCIQTMRASISLDVADVRCLTASSGVASKVVRRRNSTIECTFVLDKHEAELFDRYINNTTTRFCFNFGPKSGGNWVAGKCGCLYVPSCTVSAVRVGDSDGSVVFLVTISPFVDSSGNPEIYLNLL